MGRSLVYFGLLVLAGGAWLLLADEFGWIAGVHADAWFPTLAKAGGTLVVAGFALSILGPMWRSVSRSRCVRCSRPIERGQTYCNDHLRATLNEYQDQARSRGVI